MGQLWKIGELARMAGLTIRTLRYYDRIGLFSPSGHTESGHRQYSEADVSRLQHILSLKELGLSLAQIKAALDGGRFRPDEVVALQIARLEGSIRAQRELLAQFRQMQLMMEKEQPPTIEQFTKLLGAMKMSQETLFANRKMDWERHLDLLGEWLSEEPDAAPGEGGARP